MARTVDLTSITEALNQNDKAFVRIRGRVVSPPKSTTINGSNGPWTKMSFQVEDESGKASMDWCKPTAGLQVGDWIEAGPNMDGGKFGGCAIQEYNGTKKISVWEGRLTKIQPPASGASAGGQQQAGAAPRGPAIPWAQAIALWDRTWHIIGSSAAPEPIAGQAAVELYKAALAGRVTPPLPEQAEDEPVFEQPEFPGDPW